MADVRFDGRVAIVTGAGGGLGRAHAMLLASRGAKVVVNDLGGAMDGTGKGTAAAEKVCAEIKAKGGQAEPDFNSVSTMAGAMGLIETAKKAFGKVDILVNNAGILRDVSLMKMREEDWDAVIAVHLKGTFNCTKAAFPVMREGNYGRIVNTTSSAGLFGNFGQTNYAAAKMGIVGFGNALKHEGAKYNIKVNTIAPFGGTRLTATVLPPPVLEAMKPEVVSPMVAYLCSEECGLTGNIIVAGAGYFGRVAMREGKGCAFDGSKPITLEMIRENLAKITDMTDAKEFDSVNEEGMEKIFSNVKT
ncbi:MAG: SDR family oxidoreductase [Proteobacteria bacterium]|nr:SDR family oxidoreductase [Pseudomonadota bacterium]